jgi:predicted amidohydrolase YtcJ
MLPFAQISSAAPGAPIELYCHTELCMLALGPVRGIHVKFLKLMGYLLALAVATPSWAASDQILLHGHIFTGDPQARWVDAIALSGSQIDAAGSESAVRRWRGAKTQIVDLQGQTVIPGIVDAHIHTLYGAYALSGFNLSTPEWSITPDKPDALVAAVKAFADAHPEAPILFGRADFSAVPPTTPSHTLLDRAVADRPIIVHNTSEHAVWLNSAAMALAGLTDKPVADPDEERGVVRDASGHPSGVLMEAAMQIAARAVDSRLSTEEKLALLRKATLYLNSFGITSVVNATGDLAEIKLYAALRDRGELTLRTRTAFGAVAVRHRLTPQFLADLEEARGQYHDKWVGANLVKFFADGSTGLIPPLIYEPGEYKNLVFELDKRGYQIMTHALRDDSVQMVLNAYERLELAHGARDRRLRLEHVDQTYDEDIPRFAKLSVIPVMEISFCCSPDGYNFDPANSIPTDRWHSLEQSGATVSFGSDWPCTWPPSPFVAIEEATTRDVWRSADTDPIAGQPLDGGAQGGAKKTGAVYVPTERISVEDAVLGYTRVSAYAAFEDSFIGTLEAGKEADLVVLSQDIFSVPKDRISQTSVVFTMVGGKVVYRASP